MPSLGEGAGVSACWTSDRRLRGFEENGAPPATPLRLSPLPSHGSLRSERV